MDTASTTTNTTTSTKRSSLSKRNGDTSEGHITELVFVDRSRRVVPLLFCAQCVLVYLSVWQLVLIGCNLFMLTSSLLRKRHFLVVQDRFLHWTYLLSTLALIVWCYLSSTLVKRKDNLDLVTALGLFALVLILLDIIFIVRLLAEFILAHGFNGYLLQILAHSEVMYHWLLFGSRIVCLTLWICFFGLGGHLSHTKWTPLWSSRQVNLATTDFNQYLTDYELTS